ncbi:MAG: excinuclease ABC subunit UvrB [Calditrichaeota bacterium]|nr:MAG: excinuclease ABC subunit UvrB [Calditrichota bacterium]
MNKFKLVSNYKPAGDQPKAIEELLQGIEKGQNHQTLLGVTGSGKTFSMANIIEKLNRPTLIISHNKTLAAQLYSEFRNFFPENAVEYFISYYDYYQPESYLPTTDTYIEKVTAINENIDRLRLRATSSALARRDVIIVASVSSIYGLGNPEQYRFMVVEVSVGDEIERNSLLRKLVDIYYTRNDIAFERGTFRVRGDIIEIIPAYEETAIRISMFGDEIESIEEIDTLKGETIRKMSQVYIYPAKHFVTTEDRIEKALKEIEEELVDRLAYFRKNGKLLEAQRIETRVNYDLEMMKELGFCSGIENYSRFMDGRKEGETPHTLFDYFPKDYLLFIDESHATLPQIRAMYNGDRSRKMSLVDHGFRLPSALDNRPLKFEEFALKVNQAIYVSATPADLELEKSGGVVTEQIIRPTGLLDPEIEVRKIKGQIDDLLIEIQDRVWKDERILITTLTKKMSESLADFLKEAGVKVKYLHSEIHSLDRIKILRELRLAEIDVLVGVNLLREGLDLPEVSLVIILDADKEGFLRSERSLMQTVGRAARNSAGKVIFYADKMTNSMAKTISETNRRRKVQMEYNQKHGIQPKTITRTKDEIMKLTSVVEMIRKDEDQKEKVKDFEFKAASLDPVEVIKELEKEMYLCVERLEFEKAAQFRDEIQKLQKELGQKFI